ncbi:MAG: FkbM family methyltransferase [Anaerolineae bacterium]|nr:FkbM family methyltransferase [Anaerolineae bacterium]
MNTQKLSLWQRIQGKWRLLPWAFHTEFRQTVTVSTEQGIFTVRPGKQESIGRTLYCYRQYELGLMSTAVSHLRQLRLIPPKGQGTIVDVGANIGVISIGMLARGEMEKAIAIEPEPRNFSLLQQNVQQNGLSGHIICLPYAAADKASELSFELSDSNFGDHRVQAPGRATTNERYGESHRQQIMVKGETLDTLLTTTPESYSHNIALLWVDVQGYEGFVFEGARDLLAKGVPAVAEIWPYAIQRAGMDKAQFCQICHNIWANYWVWHGRQFVCHPIHTLNALFAELSEGNHSSNVIFTP